MLLLKTCNLPTESIGLAHGKEFGQKVRGAELPSVQAVVLVPIFVFMLLIIPLGLISAPKEGICSHFNLL
jgi:hypothetical protein